MTNVPQSFSIELTDGPDGSVTVRAVGDLDLLTAPELRGALDRLAAEKRPALLDLTEVSFMDSSGLATLIHATREAQRDGWSFAVTGELSAPVALLFELTEVRAQIPFADGV
jgi:anti-anti-sigma factor